MYTIFTRKPSTLAEVEQNMQYLDRREYVFITEVIELISDVYDYFWHHPTSNDHAFLKGKGGYEYGQRTAVLLASEGRKNIIVDPSGTAYGRYVGFEVLKVSG